MENKKYYNYLEKLRRSGITNMYGAAPYLQAEFGLEYKKAVNILMSWMKNYDKLKKKLGW
jgi:hypothetical protein